MLSFRLRAGTVVCVALFARVGFAQTCKAFGMDFQAGQSYFINQNSTEKFTYVNQFSGCEQAIAYNVLIDPNGDQLRCSETNLKPDLTDMMATCPIEKDQMFTGDWSVLLLSNNGNAEPVAFSRGFHLSVGPQSTSTYTPTITETVIVTPIKNQTSTTTDTSTLTLPPSTITVPSLIITPTKTIVPPRVTTTTTKILGTATVTKFTVTIVKTTKTKTATCIKPTRPLRADVVAPTSIQITVLPPSIAALLSVPTANPRFAVKRFGSEKVQLNVRAPDPQPLIVTEDNTSLWKTSTSTSSAPTSTITVIVGTTVFATSTPPPVTVVTGRTVLPTVTITAPTSTTTRTSYTVFVSTITKVATLTYTITTTTTPPPASTSCKLAGGVLG